MPKIQARLQTPKEAAERLGVAPWQVSRCILAGEVEVLGVGRYFVVPETSMKALERALERRGYLTPQTQAPGGATVTRMVKPTV